MGLALAGAIVAMVARSHGGEFSGYASYRIASRLGLVAYSFWFYPSTLMWSANLAARCS